VATVTVQLDLESVPVREKNGSEEGYYNKNMI